MKSNFTAKQSRKARAVLAALLPLAAAAQNITDVGSRKQLFIDHKFIESSEGIRLTMNAPYQTREKILVTDQPWERDGWVASYSTVIQENGKIRMWYQMSAGKAGPKQNPPMMAVGYAESTDGIHFTKPVLGLVDRDGSRQNNLVLPPDLNLMTVGGSTVWRDDNPNCPPEARYKSWMKIYPKPGSGIKGPHRVFISPDGLNWKMDLRSVTGLRAADTQPSWFWDPRVGRYIGYSREWVRRGVGYGARMASYNESDDMIHWDSPEMSLELDERDMAAGKVERLDLRSVTVQGENIVATRSQGAEAVKAGEDQVLTPTMPLDYYGPGVFPYEGVYLALSPIFYHWRMEGRESWPDTSDLHLSVSRDGLHFTRPEARRPFLSTGPDGSFDSKWIYPVLRPVRMGDELWIYYFGTNRDHGNRLDALAEKEMHAISRSILRVDGFVSADADYEGGTFLTPPLRFTGTRLELNINTGAGGSAKVEILSESGRRMDGFSFHEADEINANRVRQVVTWRGKSDVSALAGKAVRLRIRMRSAKLYAFQFTG
ncbi:MAG: hypothetical protein FJW30_14935 [Acidobacteria bacterium]|nr:hypothetical protein [Acidobacteriota bacterium]